VAEQHDESESSSGPDKPEPEAVAVEQAEAHASGADEAAEVVHHPDAISAAPLKKKKKKRAIDAAPEPIRDRNRRLRAEALGANRRSTADERRAPARALEAGEIVDDALSRTTQAAGEWLKKNFNIVQWVILAAIVGWVGYAIYSYRAGRAAEQASAKLTAAIRAEDARIGSDDSRPDPQTGIVDTRAAYPTNVDRLQAAEKQYRAIAQASSQSTASVFAKLGLASVLYDQGKFADAKAAYQSVKDSTLASKDGNVKGRALEGIGISAESLGDKDGASKAFGELANVDGFGFGALGAYHKARLAFAAGESDKAKELLKSAQKQLDDATDKSEKVLGNPGYLELSVRELLRRIDPTAVTAPSGNSLTAEQIQRLTEQMGEGAGAGGKGISKEKLNELLKHISSGAPSTPAAPASAP
jgi:predicted negative regulator of RcsB-dependent stress response